MTAEVGIAEVLVMAKDAWILTNKFECERLFAEEVSGEFQKTAFPWQDTSAVPNFIKEKVGDGNTFSDRPQGKEIPLPNELQIYKMRMQPEEIIRYRDLRKKTAKAMTDAMGLANPEWTGQLAGTGAKALWSRGFVPTLILVAGTERGKKFRHPTTKPVPLAESAMIVFCARAHGLYANLTRFIFFREPSVEESKRFRTLHQIESAAFKAT